MNKQNAAAGTIRAALRYPVFRMLLSGLAVITARLEAVTEAWYLRRSRPYLVGWRSIAPVLVQAAINVTSRPRNA